MKWPSGENLGPSSLKGVCRKEIGFLSPNIGSTHKSNLVCGLKLVNATYCPSLDQSLGHFLSSVLRISSSLAAPLVGFSKKLPMPLRSETKRIFAPSGDQIGRKSSQPLKVKRVEVARAASMIHMSRVPVCGSQVATATRFSSGEREILLRELIAPAKLNNLPLRSNQVSWLRAPPLRHTRTPSSETE